MNSNAMMIRMLVHAVAAFACRMAIDQGVFHGEWAWMLGWAWLAAVVNSAAATTYGLRMWVEEPRR